MGISQEALTEKQFGPQAAAYVKSAVHASGDDLERIVGMVQGRHLNAVLDLGCGGGHVTYAIAPHVAAVTSYDLSVAMLEAVAQEAGERGLFNVFVEQGTVEHLPFEDAHFDCVVSRYSAHHWNNLPQALAEARRVLKPGGLLVIADLAAPQDAKADTFLQAIEMLRDPSHIRSRSEAEWRALLQGAHLREEAMDRGRLRLEYKSWLGRMNTPTLHGDAILSLQAVATDDMRAYFEIADDGSFSVDTLFIIAS